MPSGCKDQKPQKREVAHLCVLLHGNWRKKWRLIIDGDNFRSLSFPLSNPQGCCRVLLFLSTPPLPPSSSLSTSYLPPFLPCLSSDLTSSLSTCSFLSPSLSLLPHSRILTSLACMKRIHHPSMSPHLVPSCFLHLGVLHLSVRPNRTKIILTVSAYLSICARRKEGSPLLGAHLELWAVLGEGIMGYEI